MHKNNFAVLILVFLICSCSHSIHQVYMSSSEPGTRYDKGWVTAEASDYIILSFAQDTSYVEKAYKKLEDLCPNGVDQVSTEHLTSFNFLSYDQKIYLRGLCHD